MKITGDEYLADPAKAHATMREREESLEIVDSVTGKTRMIMSYAKPAPACTCSAAERMWTCLACDGYAPPPPKRVGKCVGSHFVYGE